MVTLMCTEEKLPGAKKFRNNCVIPKDSEKPLDGLKKQKKPDNIRVGDKNCGTYR